MNQKNFEGMRAPETAIWNWRTSQYKAYVERVNGMYRYTIHEPRPGGFGDKPLVLGTIVLQGNANTLAEAQQAVFEALEAGLL